LSTLFTFLPFVFLPQRRLVDTGQGYQRLQSCPGVRAEMGRILSAVQRQAGPWVGLSVVHLGDRDVPNGELVLWMCRVFELVMYIVSLCEGSLRSDGHVVCCGWGDVAYPCISPIYYLSAALVFIDKYTQVPRILAPIVQCIESLPRLVEDPAFHAYVSQEWGSIDGLRLQILSDFFKHGFDGSGAFRFSRVFECVF